MKEKFWDIFSSKYDKITQSTNLTRDVEIKKSLKYFQRNNVALDYGCGTGTLAIAIADKVQKVFAIDISSGMLEVAKKKAAEKQITNVEFLKISLFDEELHQEYFDIIFAFNVLHFIEDRVKYIHRIHDILKPGGYFISSTECGGENKKSFINVVTSLLSSVRIIPYVRLLTKNELDSSIIDCGFEIVEREDFYNLNQPNHFVVAKKVQTA